MKEEMQKWKEEIGMEAIQRPASDTLTEALSFSSRELSAVENDKLHDILMTLSNYYLFLQTQVGLLYSRLSYMKEMINKSSAAKASSMKVGGIDERRLLVVASDEALNKQDEQCMLLKAKLDILRPLADGIKVKIDSVQRILYRKRD